MHVRARHASLRRLASVLLLVASCRGDTTPPDSSEASLVLAGVRHTLVGTAGRRGTIQADTALVGERLGMLRLIRPRLILDASPTRATAVEIAADSGTLEVATGIVRLLRPGRVVGASASLTGRDTVLYDPVDDSLRALPGDGDDATAPR